MVEHLYIGQQKKPHLIPVNPPSEGGDGGGDSGGGGDDSGNGDATQLKSKLSTLTNGLETVTSGEGALVKYSDSAFKSIQIKDAQAFGGTNYNVVNICSCDGSNSISMDIAFKADTDDYYVRYSEDNETTWTEFEHVS